MLQIENDLLQFIATDIPRNETFLKLEMKQQIKCDEEARHILLVKPFFVLRTIRARVLLLLKINY